MNAILHLLTVLLMAGAGLLCAAPASDSAASGESGLPRVLLLGDSLHRANAERVAALLAGRVEVVMSRDAWDAAYALANLDMLLDGKKWDAIHFNFGLSDLNYRDPKTKAVRTLSPEAGGVILTSPDTYESNLRTLVGRLQATGTRLVWASTTPIPEDTQIWVPGDEVRYNAIAARVMAETGVEVNDLHGFCKAFLSEKVARNVVVTNPYQQPSLEVPMAASILKVLGLMPPPAKGPVKVFILAGGLSMSGDVSATAARNFLEAREGGAGRSGPDVKAGKAGAAHDASIREDVWVRQTFQVHYGDLGYSFGGRHGRNGVGPELGFGCVMGDHCPEQVLILKVRLIADQLGLHMQPPSSAAKGRPGPSYTKVVGEIRAALETIKPLFMTYDESLGYELAGLVWDHGDAEKLAPHIEAYEENLTNLIKDLRKEFGVDDLPVVVLGTGIGGRDQPAHPEILKAQMAVAARPEFKGTVVFTETRDFWRPAKDSPADSSVFWNNNPESVLLIGEAAARDMIKLLRKRE